MGRAAVYVKGSKETMRALRKIDPELASQLNKRMNDGARTILDRAGQSVPPRPMRNWGQWTRKRDGADLNWEPDTVRKGLKYTRKGGRGSASGSIGGANVKGMATFSLVNRSPIGAIYEMAGSKGGSSPQGRVFVRNLTGNYKPAPRLLVETWRSMKGITMMAAIAHKCARIAEERVQKELNSGS
jgi:hypothetical protein